MKVFLNENFILLNDRNLLTRPENSIVQGCSSILEVESVIASFEKEEERSNLLLYPASDNFDLPAGFVSLFKTIEAAGGLVKNELGEMLFIYRWGKWDLPKGKLHKKNREGYDACAVREVKEETGLHAVSIIQELFPTFHIYHEKGIRILKKTWWFEMAALKSESLKPQEEEGITSVKWVDPHDVEMILANTYASLRELINLVMRNA
jgi:8-oxo-dGTP pyrophosphatase MutT (NUDIX family)